MKRTREDVDFPLGPETSKKRQEDVGDAKKTMRDHIRMLLSEIPGGADNRLSFKDVADHTDAREKDWDAAVSGDLKAIGVDMSRRFRLMHEPGSDNVLAGSDHPDKTRIDQYFASNPEMTRDFDTILQLGKLVDVANRKLSRQEMEQPINADAMAWWYHSNMDTASLFTGGGVVFGTGGSTYKGLDIRV